MHEGILVTEPGDLDAPLAFVFDDASTVRDVETFVAYAALVADHPDLVDLHTSPHRVLDLRDRGRVDSKRPIPGWCYALRVRPLDDDGQPLPDVDAIAWAPFCPVRLGWMVHQYLRETACAIGHPQTGETFGIGVFAGVDQDEQHPHVSRAVELIEARPIAYQQDPHEAAYDAR